jgi:hypothetical protein
MSKSSNPKIKNAYDQLTRAGGSAGAGRRSGQPGGQGIEEKAMRQELEKVKNEIKEVNLLNAKLLFVNKVFKANNLSEGEAEKVIKIFDKASSPREAKLIYESLIASKKPSTNVRKSLKENLGFASKPAGATRQDNIVDPQYKRWQKIANIK